MLLQGSSAPANLLTQTSLSRSAKRRRRRSYNGQIPFFLRRRARTTSSTALVCLGLGIEDIAQITHNKVLVAAAVSGAIGQLSKPFTSAILYGDRRSFNFKAAFQAGGFPSTHSSAVVATATALGIERGFSDAIFGLAVVYAALVMYDSQGVRREVATHAKALNSILCRTQMNPIPTDNAADLINSQPRKSSVKLESSEADFLEEANPFLVKPANSLLLESDNRINQSKMLSSSGLVADAEGELAKVSESCAPLNEAVGHSVIEVIAGALLGLFVSLAVFTIT